MDHPINRSAFDPEGLKHCTPELFLVAKDACDEEELRVRLTALAQRLEYETFFDYSDLREGSIIRVRDCAQALRSIVTKRSEDLAQFSMVRAIRDIACDLPRPDLTPAFYADLLHLLLGLQGKGPGKSPVDSLLETSSLRGRSAAIERSRQLDELWNRIEGRLHQYSGGLEPAVVAKRKERRDKILAVLRGCENDWTNWRWHVRNVVRDAETLSRLVTLTDAEARAVEAACRNRIPFGITPYYLSLMDEEPSEHDRSIRAQVIPPEDYVRQLSSGLRGDSEQLDFMLEEDTSPVDLITRRYPAIAVFKPYNTCPQICVYCQRNWEIDEVLDPRAMARPEQIDAALGWLRDHPSIHEVLMTGGDPLTMGDGRINRILEAIAAVPNVERIRIGTRALVTMPVRVTENLCSIFGRFRRPGRREIVVVTHVQHPYEVTPEMIKAVEMIRSQGIPIYNQLVYTFWISRRFEATALRRMLRTSGISPYYTFNTKGKEETRAYRVPIARLLQEQKEEARLLPGMARTDEAVYNVPGLGKNYLRARQHRQILSILPDGARVYEFHPWEKNISGTGPMNTYICADVPILEYLDRLAVLGEDVAEYDTIWYYF